MEVDVSKIDEGISSVEFPELGWGPCEWPLGEVPDYKSNIDFPETPDWRDRIKDLSPELKKKYFNL